MGVKLQAIRFCVGPWDGRYSDVWRIWTDKGFGNVYLGVRSLAGVLKVSLHSSGRFRAAFTKQYNDRLVSEGKDASVDRAFMKWQKRSPGNWEMLQALDIHFPLSALSLPDKPRIERKGRKLFLLEPSPSCVGSNDTVTLKIMFHKLHPDSRRVSDALSGKKIMPFFLD